MVHSIKIILFILFFALVVLFFINDDQVLQIILFLLSAIFASIYCVLNTLFYSIDDDDDLVNNTNIETINIEVVQNNLIVVKVNNIDDLHPNFSKECCICLESIDPIDSFKLSNCNYHIFHEICIKSYIENNFTRCPVCNI